MAGLIGKEIGKYRITERIGRGGMAEVFLGVHIHLDDPVAIKVLHDYLLEGKDFVKRFKREAKAVAKLRHPNIVRVYDLDFQDEIIFMAMDYIDGVTLEKRIMELNEQGKRFPTKQIESIINDIAGALDFAHSKGMLHRDVKPSNILIDKDGKAYLADFGIAKIIGEQKITGTGDLIGTPAYMSPEQCRGDELTEESDIYSLGIVAFEMLTGQVPYDAETPIVIVQKQISDPVPELSSLADDVPASAQEVIEKALAKVPDSRFSSADELVVALSTALQASESTEPAQRKPSRKTTKVDDEALFAPTVGMEGMPTPGEFDQPTVLMEEDKGSEQKDAGSPPEKKTYKAQTAVKDSNRRILTWGLIIGSVALVGVVTVIGIVAVLTQVIDFRLPGSESEPNSFGSEILFQDDFSSNTHGWTEDYQSENWGETSREVVDGKYRISLQSLSTLHFVTTPVPEFQGKDFIFSIDATVVDMSVRPGDFFLQFSFREADGLLGKHYSFRYYGDGHVEGQLWSTGTFESVETILDLTTHPAIKLQQGVTNRFSFRIKDNDFTLYANGEEVATVRDATINEEGNISILMGLFEPNDTLTIEFDNLVIEGLGDTPGVTETSGQSPADAEHSETITTITLEPTESPVEPMHVLISFIEYPISRVTCPRY